ncbi:MULTISPECIES: glycosyltransferase family 2 protein [Henriciella]|uniref:Glycosyl transferase n=1 Tax=Henriciella pelagia TaxID=1977912 RepID=A0ABQ1JJ98_9PROT|nr:glycosyltransferase [Henriciella pelagia]GGB67908.1 glycosyl transferase [Henriciella pelagia]
MAGKTRLAVAIATLGRPDTVAENIEILRRQSRPADRILLSVTGPEDLPDNIDMTGIETVFGSKGLCAQRNRALDALQEDVDYIIFFDDDYVASKFALERIEAYFNDNPDIVGIMGHVLADGIKGPGIKYAEACRIVEAYDAKPRPPVREFGESDGLYGCNMAYRASAIGETRFDENLLYYGWLEDNDFSNQLLGRGRLVHTNAFAGVHCGVKTSRSPGLRLGYSQIANPVYLMKKGTLPKHKAWTMMSRNMLANHARTVAPEPWVDRWGRAKGNWLAIRHALTGKISPTYIQHL